LAKVKLEDTTKTVRAPQQTRDLVPVAAAGNLLSPQAHTLAKNI